MKTSIPTLSLVLAAAGVFNPAAAATHEHNEFDATLQAPYHGDPRNARTFTMSFEYPGLRARRPVTWRLELVAPSGRRVAQWQGRLALAGKPRDVAVRWTGVLAGRKPAPGVYHVRLHASSGNETADQAWDIAVGGVPAPALPAFVPLPSGRAHMMAAPAPGALPYTVYYGNLHSQTRDSDGGGPVADCHGAQDPQSAPYGPDAAYPYARRHGLDFLMVSEHNHMYDGSDGTNPDADPAKAKAMYQAGLKTARDYSEAHPGFLALYGMEWGVIGNGGHLNIFDSDELLGWERNAKGELVADTATPKSDYAALTGQFNHPAPTGQFTVGGTPLAYTPDGDAVMALCEVVNSSAFSVSENEGETRRSNFELACNKLLEAGYHVAFSSNQDNHCANWGASYSNRSAVLIPNGVPLTRTSFLEAVHARRVFSTMDKDAQVVLTANGHLMGERFDNTGALRLQVAYASATGRQAATVAIVEGVPGRNGDVSQLADKADVTTLPSPGAHFYYAKVTQDDGKILWSAPVWVAQQL
jgi:hypothetical protein